MTTVTTTTMMITTTATMMAMVKRSKTAVQAAPTVWRNSCAVWPFCAGPAHAYAGETRVSAVKAFVDGALLKKKKFHLGKRPLLAKEKKTKRLWRVAKKKKGETVLNSREFTGRVVVASRAFLLPSIRCLLFPFFFFFTHTTRWVAQVSFFRAGSEPRLFSPTFAACSFLATDFFFLRHPAGQSEKGWPSAPARRQKKGESMVTSLCLERRCSAKNPCRAINTFGVFVYAPTSRPSSLLGGWKKKKKKEWDQRTHFFLVWRVRGSRQNRPKNANFFLEKILFKKTFAAVQKRRKKKKGAARRPKGRPSKRAPLSGTTGR